MEITTDIVKVFGAELAKIYSSQISEEDLKEAANKAFASINRRESTFQGYRDSPLEKAIKEALIERVAVNINEMLSTPENKEILWKEAETIIKEAKEVAHAKLVDKISDGFCNSALRSNDISLLSATIHEALFKLANR